MSDERKPTPKAARARIDALEGIVRDTLWMARRYAHGRRTYATSMYNGAARQAVALVPGLRQVDGTWFAPDGDGPTLGHLTPDEHARAVAADDFFTGLHREELRRGLDVDRLIRAADAVLAAGPDAPGADALTELREALAALRLSRREGANDG